MDTSIALTSASSSSVASNALHYCRSQLYKPLPVGPNCSCSNAQGEIRDPGCSPRSRKMVLNQSQTKAGLVLANNAIHLSRHQIRF